MAYFEMINGPSANMQVRLEQEEYVLGRHPECDIVLEIPGASRKHARTLKNGIGYSIEDLDSRNGTFVNGKLIGELTRLHDGDTIRICELELAFFDDSDGGSNMNVDGSVGSEKSFGIKILDDEDSPDVVENSITNKLDVRSSNYEFSASAESKLAALLEIMKNLGRAVGIDEVLPKVLDSLFNIFIQADRGFIVLKDPSGQLIVRWSKARRQSEDELRVSKTILRRVMETKEAIVSIDAGKDFELSQSVADFRIHSMIVAPLLNNDGEAIGAIQIDTTQTKAGYDKKDLEILVAVANQAGMAIENAELHEKRLAQKLVEQDLELARQVQMAFLPRESPNIDGYSFYQYYNPAQQIGGDYFDYLDLDETRTAIMIADVVGHGVAAAMFMAKLSAEARFAFAAINDPRKAMEQLNERITALEAERFITMTVMILDKTTHKVSIVIAGHMPPIQFHQDNSVSEPASEIGGTPLGVFSGEKFDSFELILKPGESLTLYTDGIFEAPNAQQEQFSIERVRQFILRANGDVKKAGTELVHSVQEHIKGCEQEDDMCVVILGRNSETDGGRPTEPLGQF